jgi:hypothetical protein
MGIAVPLIPPSSTIMLLLDLPTLPSKNKNKKCPAPPQVSHRLKLPPNSQSKRQAFTLLASPSIKEMLAQMDSHDLKNLLLGNIVNTELLFDNVQQNLGCQAIHSEVKESSFQGGPRRRPPRKRM